MTVAYQARAAVAQEDEAAVEHARVVAGEEMGDERVGSKNHKGEPAMKSEESAEQGDEVAGEAFGGDDHAAAAEDFGGVVGEEASGEDDEAAEEEDEVVWEEFSEKDNAAAQAETRHQQVGPENKYEQAKEAGLDEDDDVTGKDGHDEEMAADHAGGEDDQDEAVAEQQQRPARDMWKLQQPQAIQDGHAAAMVMETPPPNWIMLAALPGVLPSTQLPEGQDVLTKFESPPMMSSLILSRRVCVMPLDKDSPLILSTSPSGIFLLMASKNRLSPTEGKADELGFSITINTEFKPYFYLCNVYEGNSVLIPFSDHTVDPSFLGLSMHPLDSRRHIVAELLPDPKSPVLFCIGDGDHLRWEKKELEYSHDYFPGAWAEWDCQNVLVYKGETWWFVPDYGLFHCDPFLERPHLKLQRLPPVRDKSQAFWGKKMGRHVQVSGGELRYIVVHGTNKNPAVTMFTLVGDKWNQEPYKSFELIFEHKTWRDTKLVREKPTILLIDPCRPNIVYFAQMNRIFSVDLDMMKVLTCEPLEMRQADEVKAGLYLSKHVRAWELPSTHSLLAQGLITQWALRRDE